LDGTAQGHVRVVGYCIHGIEILGLLIRELFIYLFIYLVAL